MKRACHSSFARQPAGQTSAPPLLLSVGPEPPHPLPHPSHPRSGQRRRTARRRRALPAGGGSPARSSRARSAARRLPSPPPWDSPEVGVGARGGAAGEGCQAPNGPGAGCAPQAGKDMVISWAPAMPWTQATRRLVASCTCAASVRAGALRDHNAAAHKRSQLCGALQCSRGAATCTHMARLLRRCPHLVPRDMQPILRQRRHQRCTLAALELRQLSAGARRKRRQQSTCGGGHHTCGLYRAAFMGVVRPQRPLQANTRTRAPPSTTACASAELQGPGSAPRPVNVPNTGPTPVKGYTCLQAQRLGKPLRNALPTQHTHRQRGAAALRSARVNARAMCTCQHACMPLVCRCCHRRRSRAEFPSLASTGTGGLLTPQTVCPALPRAPAAAPPTLLRPRASTACAAQAVAARGLAPAQRGG